MIIDLSDPQPVRFGLTGTAEIVQNVRTIITTMAGTVPLSRGLGIDPGILDEPRPIAEARITASIRELVPLYEPRASVTEIRFAQTDDPSKIIPIVTIEIGEGVS